MGGRRYNCGCGKRRFRDEQAALAAAAGDRAAYGGVVSVYRCPGGLAWHLTSRGFTPEALRSAGRRLAFELTRRGTVGLDEFLSAAGIRPDGRRSARVRRCAAQMAALGLVRTGPGGLVAVDRAGLDRVVRIGLDAYAEERSG